jgi:hypothetical protein
VGEELTGMANAHRLAISGADSCTALATPRHSDLCGRHALFVTAMIVVMLAVYLLKGEPPRWRWGDRTKPRDD